jgi:hypothetical protein
MVEKKRFSTNAHAAKAYPSEIKMKPSTMSHVGYYFHFR